MRHGLHFTYNGISSVDMGVIKATLNSGLSEDVLISGKQILEEKIEGRDKPYFYGVEYDTLSFSVIIFFEDNMTEEHMRSVLRWLNQDSYKPFFSNDEPHRVMYVMPVNDIVSSKATLQQGYLEIEFRADDVNTFSPIEKTQEYSFTSNTGGQNITVNNKGDFNCYPIVHIEKIGNGNVTIRNNTNNIGDFSFTGLQDKEKLEIDCEGKIIDTTYNRPRYDDFNNNFLELKPGNNTLRVTGDLKLQLEMEYRTY